MGTPHNDAQIGEIATKVLLPGDPLRAKYIADHFLSNVTCFNSVRNMLGFTGDYKGKRISVMGSGMGGPSIGIYSYELYKFYQVESIIRVGSLGAIQPDMQLGDLVIAQGAGSDSNFANQYMLPGPIAAIPAYELLSKAVEASKLLKVTTHLGNVVSSDFFYHAQDQDWKKWAKMGVLGLEMEAYALYHTALHLQKKALAICTVSDSMVTGLGLTSEERASSFDDMIELCLTTFS